MQGLKMPNRVNRYVLIFVVWMSGLSAGCAQIRLNNLTVGRKDKFEILGTDILVVDTLILKDSSRILLNSSKKDNFIHAKKLIIGKGCFIVGRGQRGENGKVGSNGVPGDGPCRDGARGKPGFPGTSGNDGNNLFLYFDEAKINGNLTIDLAGGDGGDGGKGGAGGDGEPGTKLCQGGSGGDGGNGAVGGNGGHAGNLTVTSKYGTDVRGWIGEKIIVRSYGGFAGQGGEGGQGGQRGLSTSKDGDQGKKGLPGLEGQPGKPGGIFFERK
jgi:hypothetical protein